MPEPKKVLGGLIGPEPEWYKQRKVLEGIIKPEELIKPEPGEYQRSKEWWEKQVEKFSTQQPEIEPRGYTPLSEIPAGKSIWGTIFNQIAGRFLSSGLAQDPDTGKLVPVTQLQYPEAETKRIRAAAEQSINNAANAFIMSQFYDNMEVLQHFKDDPEKAIASVDDYLEVAKIPTGTLPPELLADMEDAIAAQQVKEKDVPDWLKVSPEEETVVRAFMEEKAKPPQLSLQAMTIDELLKALPATGTVKIPEGMTEEELIRIASVMDLPTESVAEALDYDTIVSIISESYTEWDKTRQEVLAGVREWEPPDQTFFEKAFFMVQSPMQQMAILMQPYLKNFAYPMVGLTAKFFWGKFIDTYNTDVAYSEYRASGMSVWQAAGAAWEDNDTAWYWKLPMEILMDPITYVPGALLKVPGMALMAAGRGVVGVGLKTGSKTLLGAGLEMSVWGGKTLAINRGMWEVLDIPWTAMKYFQSERMAKTFTQLVAKQTDDFVLKFHQAVEVNTGKIIGGRGLGQATMDDIAQTLLAARKAFQTVPDNIDPITQLGGYLARHEAMSANQVWSWSKTHAGQLLEPGSAKATPGVLRVVDDSLVSEVNDIISDLIMKKGSRDFNAVRMARALMIEETLENITKLGKEIIAFGAKRATDVDTIIRIGKSAKIGAVGQMVGYMMKRQKAIANSMVRGPQASGSFFEGVVLAMQRGVDRIEHNRLRMVVDRWWIRPLAEANLGSLAYPVWNIFEGLGVSLIEGVIPRFMKDEAYIMLTKGLIGDPALKLRPGGDVAGIFKTVASDRKGAWTMLPKFWRQITLGVSDWAGSALRRNFVARKMQQYLAEYTYQAVGEDIWRALGMLSKNPPKIAKTTLGLTAEELERELTQRLLSSVDDALALKSILTNGSLMQGEMIKILRKAEFLSPRAKALGEQLIKEGKVLQTPVRTTPYGIQATPDIKAREFWDSVLEYNKLRTELQGRSDAAGLMAVRLENAGDMLREMGKEFSDTGYFMEKLRKISGSLTDSDWKRPLTSVEVEKIATIRKNISDIPISTEVSTEIKNMMLSLVDRDMAAVGHKLGNIERLVKVPRYDGLENFVRQVTDTAVEDLRQYPYEVATNFRARAIELDAYPINTKADLMEVFTNYEVMSETASFIPHRIMRQTMEEAQALRQANKWNDVEALWRRRGDEMLSAMDNINLSIEQVKAKLLANTEKLTAKQKVAMEAVLERSEASNLVRQATLEKDRNFLDDFWALPKDQRNWDDAWAFRNELWDAYQLESAIPSAGEFVTRKNLSKLYHNIPEPRLKPVDATNRALTNKDVAEVFGTHVDSLISGMLDNISMHGKPYFIQLVKQTADSKPDLFKGFTEDKIGRLYDDIIAQARLRSGADIPTEKILAQMEGIRQDLIRLKMTHSLSPEEEKALHAWIDKAVEGRKRIIGDIAPVEKFKWSQEWQKEHVANEVKAYTKGDDDLWFHGGHELEGNIISEGSYITKDIDDAFSYALSGARTGEPGEAFIYVVRKSKATVRGSGENLELLSDIKSVKRFDIGKVYPEPKVPTRKTMVSQEQWDGLRQKALDSANQDYYKSFADYTNENMIGGVMRMMFPYWSYHTYRWFYLSRAGLRHPGLPTAWGKYHDYGENGFLPTWMPNIEMNPFTGSILGTTFTLTRRDFASYYNQLGYAGEMLDYFQRFGFFPGAHVMAPIALTPLLSGRPAELAEIMPPIAKTGIDLLVASNIPGVAVAAQWLKDKIFHENFHNYYTATLVSNKQIEAGGKILIDEQTGEPQSGTDLWMKLMREQKLNDEEQRIWDEAYREAAMIGVLRSQFPQFRLRTEEYKEAYDQVTKIIEEHLGLTEQQQKELWRNHLRPTDVTGGYPLDLKMALDELWEWKIMLGRGTILMPPDISDINVHIDEYHKIVKTYQKTRLDTQAITDTNFLQLPGVTRPLDGSQWRQEYAENWGRYSNNVEDIKSTERFKDIEELLSPEGQLRMAERLGFNVPPEGPLDEAVNLYFDIELVLKADPITGEEDYDYLGFWLKREAVRMALTDEQRQEFDSFIRKYQTPMEEVFRYAYNTYIRGYKASDRIVFQSFDNEEQKLIKEFYARTTTSTRQEEIKEIVRADGLKLIAQYSAKITQARSNLREVSPKLEFYLAVFGYLGEPPAWKTDAARAMYESWEADRTSILRVGG